MLPGAKQARRRGLPHPKMGCLAQMCPTQLLPAGVTLTTHSTAAQKLASWSIPPSTGLRQPQGSVPTHVRGRIGAGSFTCPPLSHGLIPSNPCGLPLREDRASGASRKCRPGPRLLAAPVGAGGRPHGVQPPSGSGTPGTQVSKELTSHPLGRAGKAQRASNVDLGMPGDQAVTLG